MGSLKQGDRIFGNWRGGNAWYSGVIINVERNGYRVRYDDGDEKLISNKAFIQKDIAAKKYIDIERIRKGDRVLGHWKKGGKWYAAEVVDVNTKKGIIKLHFDDGDQEEISDFKLVQKDKTRKDLDIEDLEEGMRVQARWKGGTEWYPGIIDKIKDEKVYLSFDDGDKEWISDLSKIKKDKIRSKADKVTDYLRDFSNKLDDIKSDTELIKEYTSQIEDIFKMQEDLEHFLKARLSTDFGKIKHAYEDYKTGNITRGELVKRGISVIGKKFVKLCLRV